MSNLNQRLQKLERNHPGVDPYRQWLESLSDEELLEVEARKKAAIELRTELDPSDPINKAIFDRLAEAWHPHSNEGTYSTWTDKELTAELKRLEETNALIMSDADKVTNAALKAKWRTYYLGKSHGNH